MAKLLGYGTFGLMAWALISAVCMVLAMPLSEIQSLPSLPQANAEAGERILKAIQIVRDEGSAAPIAAPAQVGDLDWLEYEEPVAFAPVTPDAIGPRAGEVVTIPGVGPVTLGAHAEERHGQEALQARMVFMAGGADWRPCKDGRDRGRRAIGPKAVAVMIVENGVEVSAYISERGWDALGRVLDRDGCLPPSDPFAGAAAG